MSITRKFLKGMGLTEEQVDTIIDAHTETVDGLKKDIEKYRGDSDTLASVQKELNDLKEAGDGGLQKKLEDLQKKYDDAETAHKTELENLQKQISDRDYTDAISNAISGANDGKGLKFSSKSAQAAFIAALRGKGLELKDGALTGFDDFVKDQKATDPEAFVSDTPPARFAGRIGSGGAPAQTKSRAAELAAQYNKNLYGTPKESDK